MSIFLVHPHLTKMIFLLYFTIYIIFNGSLKLIFDQINTCSYIITNFLSKPKIFSKDIHIFNYLLHMVDFGHGCEFLKRNRSVFCQMACSDIKNQIINMLSLTSTFVFFFVFCVSIYNINHFW